MIQTQRHVNLGFTILTLNSLRSELLHVTNLETYKTRGSSTQPLGAYTVVELRSLRYRPFRSDILSQSTENNKHMKHLFTLKFIVHIDNNKQLEFSQGGGVSGGDFPGRNFARGGSFRGNFFRFRGGIFWRRIRQEGNFPPGFIYIHILTVEA